MVLLLEAGGALFSGVDGVVRFDSLGLILVGVGRRVSFCCWWLEVVDGGRVDSFAWFFWFLGLSLFLSWYCGLLCMVRTWEDVVCGGLFVFWNYWSFLGLLFSIGCFALEGAGLLGGAFSEVLGFYFGVLLSRCQSYWSVVLGVRGFLVL